MDGDRLGDLQEPDQLEPVQPLGAGLIGLDPGEAGVDGGADGDQSVDVGEPEETADAVHHRVDRGVPQPRLVEVPDVELHVRTSPQVERVSWRRAGTAAPRWQE